MDRLVSLREIELKDRPRVGGKALHLARIAQRGLPVPPAVVIPTEVFTDALRDAGVLELASRVHRSPVAADVEALRAALRGLQLSPSLCAELVRRGRALGGRLAVRSSGVDEDGRHRSFAGQHETRLEVAPRDLPQAVLQVWSSLYGPSALAYRARGGHGPQPGAMAVVIQRMVEPRASGVLFTINPLSGSWREMTVEATWGLGEALVAGQVTPHWYLVRRPRRAPRSVQRVLARVRLELVQKDLPDIPGAPPELRGEPTLDRATLFRLCRMGLRLESEMGEPQDVEFAVDHSGHIHLLQCRPITTSPTAPRSRRDVLWTRRFIGERWPEPATPLGWSLIAPVLEYFVAFPQTQSRFLGGGPPLRLVRHRPYLNVSAFRHLAFKLPGAPAPHFMLELVPPDEESDWQRRFAVLPDASVYTSFLRETFLERRWERYRYNPFTNHQHWDSFEQRLREELPGVDREPVSPSDAVRLVKAQLELVQEYVGIHICSLLFANLWYQLLDGALAMWIPDRAPALMRSIAVCPPGNRTLETNEALWELAQVASEDEVAGLAAGEAPSPDTAFGAALQSFIHSFGHRSRASWEVMTPRWADDLPGLAPFLRPYGTTGTQEPAARGQQQRIAFEEGMAELRARTRGGQRLVLEMLVHYTRRYLLLRENQRFAFDRLLYALQRTVKWLGARFAESGWIDAADDVSYLIWPEVEGLALGTLAPESVKEWIGRRRERREADLEVEPPQFLSGDEGVTAVTAGARMQGLGISPGRARGRVRVLRSLSDAQRMQPGEVLVARTVDPGWTPLLLTAKALVLEMGSRLSHGAVIAREYKVPAVVNLDGVTRHLRDGQEVTVDGTRGVVWVHP